MTQMTWSDFQKAIFQDVASGRGHTVVQARAGCGKTSTIVEALSYIPKGKKTGARLRALLVAFNKSIAEELQRRAPHYVTVSTLHSFGLRAITQTFGKVTIDKNKTITILKSLRGDEIKWDWAFAVAKVVSLAKGVLVHDEEGIINLADAFQVDMGKTAKERSEFSATVLDILQRSKDMTSIIDFDDMIWLPVVLKLQVATFPRVIVDELQDMNACQLELIIMALSPKGRFLGVGDDRQAIYQFRGAGEDSIGDVVKRLSAKVLPLSITYRCAKKIVAEIQHIVPDFQAHESNAAGEIHHFDTTQMMAEAQGGDFILSRTNAPLLRICLNFIKDRRSATIAGRDIGANLISFIKKSNQTTIATFLAFVDEWALEESMRLAMKKPPQDATVVFDRQDCYEVLCSGVKTLAEVISRIELLFSDKTDGNLIVCSSTHKAKGLERDRVFLLRDTYLRVRPAKKGARTTKVAGVSQEEKNLYYVAVTRAKKEVFFVNTSPIEKAVVAPKEGVAKASWPKEREDEAPRP